MCSCIWASSDVLPLYFFRGWRVPGEELGHLWSFFYAGKLLLHGFCHRSVTELIKSVNWLLGNAPFENVQSISCFQHDGGMGHCPGETGSLLWLSFSLQERARNRLCRYCIEFLTKNCDVLPHIMHEVTFTSPLTFHIVFLSVCVCVYVTARLGICIYGRDQTCSTKFLAVYTGQ